MALNVAANYGVEIAPLATSCETAAALGLVSNTNGVQELSREEAAVIASRLIELIGEAPETAGDALSVYEDAGRISSWAVDAVAEMTACGLMSGTAGSFNPQGKLTNEQAVALMVRVDENPAPAVTYQAALRTLALEEAPVNDCAALDLVVMNATQMMLSRTGLYEAR